jgi:hypothetical protein
MERVPESAVLACWKCGAALADLSLPLRRTDECRACRAEIHVCRMCRFYDIRKANQCAEPVADPVQNKERANFCGYLEPVAGRFRPANDAAEEARSALDALFAPKK